MNLPKSISGSSGTLRYTSGVVTRNRSSSTDLSTSAAEPTAGHAPAPMKMSRITRHMVDRPLPRQVKPLPGQIQNPRHPLLPCVIGQGSASAVLDDGVEFPRRRGDALPRREHFGGIPERDALLPRLEQL